MSRFLKDANEILQAASVVADDSAVLTILIHPRGQIHVVDGAEVPMECLQASHGGAVAFRVSRSTEGVRVEGRDGASRCILEKRKPVQRALSAAAALGLFRDRPLYSVAGAPAIA